MEAGNSFSLQGSGPQGPLHPGEEEPPEEAVQEVQAGELATFARDLAQASRCSEGTVGLRQDQPGLLRRYESPPCTSISYPNTRADSSSAVPLPSRIGSRCYSPRGEYQEMIAALRKKLGM